MIDVWIVFFFFLGFFFLFFLSFFLPFFASKQVEGDAFVMMFADDEGVGPCTFYRTSKPLGSICPDEKGSLDRDRFVSQRPPANDHDVVSGQIS